MPAYLYNPCSDGLAAKAWECLRRNDAFLKWCAALEKEAESAAEAQAEECPEMSTSSYTGEEAADPFIQAVYYCMHTQYHSRSGLSDASLSITQSWPDIIAIMREKISDAFERGKATHFHVPKLPQINLFKPKAMYPSSRFRGLLTSLEGIELTHHLIAVPKFVWDPAHKKQIKAEVGVLLNKPFARDVRMLTPIGSMLGSTAEWRAFLLFEQWKLAGYGRGRALGLVAQEIYAPKKKRVMFGRSPRSRMQTAKEFLASCDGKIEPKYKDKVEGQVECIEKAIASVYPKLTLL